MLSLSKLTHIFGKRKNQRASLRPLSGLARAGNAWRSIDEDPHFNFALGPQPAGWYELELEIESDSEVVNTKFYLDYGKGFNEADTLSLPVPTNTRTHRLAHFSQSVQKIRFDPMTHLGIFRVTYINLRLADPNDIEHLTINRLRDKHKNFQGLNWDNAVAQLTKLSTGKGKTTDQLLGELYDSTFISGGGTSNLYANWLREVESRQSLRITDIVRTEQTPLPKISILVPVYKPNPSHLEGLIKSVLDQTYTNWQLCLTDDNSEDFRITELLEKWAALDSRIDVVFRDSNGHICAASNDALKVATGEYCALLDHDDLLHKDALAHVSQAIKVNRDLKIIYSDEDKIDDSGARFDPHFKSDLNIDLLYSQNYISHLGVYSTELMRRVGGFREGYEGSQDHDLVIRCLENIQPDQVHHIPHILYHWRVSEGSTALSASEKSYTEFASLKALSDHFTRCGERVEVSDGLLPNTYRCRWLLPENPPTVSLIIPTRDGLEVLKQCVSSILEKTDYQNYEIVIVNNNSQEQETLEYFRDIEQQPKVRVIDYLKEFNFSAINNYGVLNTSSEVVGFINNDVEVINDDWLSEMVSHAIRPQIGCVGAKLYYENDTVQHGGVITGIGGIAGHSHKYFERSEPGYFGRLKLVQNYSAVTAAALVVRADVYHQVGGLRETLAVAFNDVDFCLKVDGAGYRNLWTPYAELYHYESVSRGSDAQGAKRIRLENESLLMTELWRSRLKADPYYNRNLTHKMENFEIQFSE